MNTGRVDLTASGDGAQLLLEDREGPLASVDTETFTVTPAEPEATLGDEGDGGAAPGVTDEPAEREEDRQGASSRLARAGFSNRRSAPMQDTMRVNDLILAQGLRDTRGTLADWRDGRWRVLQTWAGWSATIAVGLLVAVYVVALLSIPDRTARHLPGVNAPATLDDLGFILFGNSLVLALHAFACVAGFIAGSSLPRSAQNYSGVWRWIHDKAGPLAIAFVVGATAFSLITQAYVLGGWASTIAAQLGLSPAVLLLAVVPHALPELTALFLPLAAWTVASRAGEWHKLLAATFVTVAIAVPILIVTALVEIYVTPHLLVALASV